MIRILHAVSIMDRAGIETMLMNYYRILDRNEIQFDFVTHRDGEGQYDEEIRSLGGKIFRAPRLMPQNYPGYFQWMKHFFEEHPEYRVIHSHIDAMSFFPLAAAKRSGIPIRIAHSHSTRIENDFKMPIKQTCRKHLWRMATDCWACGEKAGEFLFGKHFDHVVIHNAIFAQNFAYREELRRKKREQLGIEENTVVIGHVGRFLKVKNHEFLLEIFREICRKEQKAILLLAGGGELMEEMEQLAEKMKIEKQVIFAGSRSDISELLMAMDVFVLPSLYEGVPLVGIEAQASGLRCFFSDKVPEEAAVTDRTEFLSLTKGAKAWAEKIWAAIEDKDGYERENAVSRIIQAGYEIETESVKLVQYYGQLLERNA